jgi:hypothetical protein
VVCLVQGFDGDRRPAFNLIVCFWIFCGIMLSLLSCTVIKDEHTVQQSIRATLDTLHEQRQSNRSSRRTSRKLSTLSTMHPTTPVPITPTIIVPLENDQDSLKSSLPDNDLFAFTKDTEMDDEMAMSLKEVLDERRYR